MSNKSKKRQQLEKGLSGENRDTRAYQGLDDAVFDALNDQVVNDDTLNIMEIRADITQPRRIIPREIRGSWNGMAEGVPALLDKWAHEAGVSASVVEKMLAGSQSVHSVAGVDPVLDEFAKVIELASSIFDIGLRQNIGVATVGGGYQLVYGERRWMAFHALAHWISEEWQQIPAKVASVSPWELAKMQAAENFQRVELNAIEKARQFAKLLIVSRADTTDVPYDSWNGLVVEGGCDRPYYAQVADGNIHRIPRGMGSQFEQALGISTGQMRNYRGLLKPTGDYEVDNSLWDIADGHDWSEKFMREMVQNLEIEAIQEILYRHPGDGIATEKALREAIEEAKKAQKEADTVTRVTVSDDSPAPSGRSFGGEYVSEVTQSPEQEIVSELPPNPAKPPVYPHGFTERYLNKRVVLRGGKKGTVINVETMGLRVRLDDGANILVNESLIVEILDASSQPYRLSRANLEALTVRYAGYYVRLSGNRVGEVLDVKDDGRMEIAVHGQPASSLHDESEIESVINEAAYRAFIGHLQDENTDGKNAVPRGDSFHVGQVVYLREGMVGAGEAHRVMKIEDDGLVIIYHMESGARFTFYEDRLQAEPIYSQEEEGDASDNGLSSEGDVEADSLLDMQSGNVSTVLFAMYRLAQKVHAEDARNVVSTLTTYSTDDVDLMAENMTADEVEALIQGHNEVLALFFENCMRSVEEYTRWMQEQVADSREQA